MASTSFNITNPLFDSQPFEELQGPQRQLSPTELEDYYREQEARDIQRKLSRRSRWSRKSLSIKSGVTASPGARTSTQPTGKEKSIRESSLKEDAASERSSKAGRMQQSDSPAPAFPALVRKQGEWNTVAPSHYRSYYEINDPAGPRYYRNHHLSRKGPTRMPAMPPSAFQTQSSPNPSLPSSQSTPVVTPDSSRVSLQPRRRKISLTLPQDNVDMLDVSDPWGQTWHHDSPYDVGLDRPADSQRQHKRAGTLRPSPLSQSTSAVDLASSSRNNSQLPTRKLSKRRNTGIRGLFGTPNDLPTSENKNSEQGFQVLRRQSRSVPTTPNNRAAPATALNSQTVDFPTPHKSASTSSLNVAASSPVVKREKRKSLLGKLVKRFSVMKKPTSILVTDSSTSDVEDASRERKPSSTPSLGGGSSSRMAGGASSTPRLSTIIASPNSSLTSREPARSEAEKRGKRVPPPSVGNNGATASQSTVQSPETSTSNNLPSHQNSSETREKENKDEDSDARSSFSYDPTPGLGKLTIANPDPTSNAASPVRASAVLPPVPPPHVEREHYIQVPTQNGLLMRAPVEGYGSLPPVERPFLPPLDPSSPLKMPSSIFGESTPRASLVHTTVAAPTPINNPLPPTPAPSSITWPSVSESQPSTVHVSLLGEESDGEQTPRRRKSPDKRGSIAEIVPPRVELVGQPRKDADSDRERSHMRRDSREDGRNAPSTEHSRSTQGSRDHRKESSDREGHRKSPSPTKTKEDRHSDRKRDRSGRDDTRVVSENRSKHETRTSTDRQDTHRSSGTSKDREREKGKKRVDETYRLIRSESKGDAVDKANMVTVTGAGEEWEVIEGSRTKSRRDKSSSVDKSRDKGKEAERNSRRSSAHRRESEEYLPSNTLNVPRNKTRESVDSIAAPVAGLSRRPETTTTHSRSLSQATTLTVPPPPPPKSHRPTSDPELLAINTPPRMEMPVSAESRPFSLDSQVQALNLNKKQPARPPPTPGPSELSLSRAPTVHATRPTSDLVPNTNAVPLKAKDAWDAERLWKAKSSAFEAEVDENSRTGPFVVPLHQTQTEQWVRAWKEPVAKPKHGLNVSVPRSRTHANGYHHPQVYPPNAYGSNHTSYTMQAPFLPHEYGHHVYAPYRPPRTPIPTFSVEFEQRRPNPLPEPPRETSYDNVPLRSQDTQITTEYWKQYSGLAAPG